MSLQSKVAIVTGGNSGIGQAIVLELARLGANVVIDYVAHPEATEALEQQVGKLGEQSIGVEADASKLADLASLTPPAVVANWDANCRRAWRQMPDLGSIEILGGPGDPTNFPASWENTGNLAYFAFREQSKGAEYRNNNNILRENSRRPRTGKFRVSSGN
jgi:short chain dehydrogenase